jgi:membrane-bound metal-dependent hydrolase YbcI (DUF457 family)
MAGLAIGWAVAGRDPDRRRGLAQAATLASIAIAPDLDLLVGRHSAETHSLGAAAIVASVAAWWGWRLGREGTGPARVWLAAFFVWLSHPVLDALALDTSPPLGVMIFWPFATGYHQTGWAVFDAISRRYWLPEFVTYNLWAVIREVVLLGPPTFVVWWARRR